MFIEIPIPFVRSDGKAPKKIIEDKNGRPIKVDGSDDYQLADASYLDMLTLFLNNLFPLVENKARENKEIRALRMEDSALATDVFRAIRKAERTMEIEKAPYEWLLRMLDNYGTDIFGVNASVIKEPLKKVKE